MQNATLLINLIAKLFMQSRSILTKGSRSSGSTKKCTNMEPFLELEGTLESVP